MKILIDPGHGGDQPGAVYSGAAEEKITLAVGLHAANILRSLGHDVYLTRDRDIGVTLSHRLATIEKVGCEAMVSIHCNASPDVDPYPSPSPPEGEGKRERGAYHSTHGTETYYRDDRDYPLANCLQQVFVTYGGMKDRGIHQDQGALGKRLTVLNNLNVPSSLIELGYLSNPDDRAYLVENINTAGELVAHGVDWFAHLKAGTEKTVWPA
jgi:N-acetylmuramoyl-L-alanine amidase